MRNKMYYAQTWDEIANMLADEADRIEQEAANGKTGLSRLQILDIIKRRGYFVVCKYSWRDDNLRAKLRKMRNEGLLDAEFCKKDIYYRMKKGAGNA